MTVPRPSLSLLVGAFAAYSYVATAVSAAWFLRRDHGLDTLASIGWAAALFSPWIVVGLMVWAVLSRMKAQFQAAMTLFALAAPVVPLAACATTFVDRAMRGSEASPSAVIVGSLDRLPVAILLYTAMVAAGLAVAYAARTRLQGKEIRALNTALQAARSAPPANSSDADAPTALIVSVGNRRVPVQPSEIEWVSSAGNYVVVHWRDREGLLRETLQVMETRLGQAAFARVHRTALINLAHVAELRTLSDGAWRATMDSGAELVISRTYRDAFLARLERRGAA